jgi:hypothetical protein
VDRNTKDIDPFPKISLRSKFVGLGNRNLVSTIHATPDHTQGDDDRRQA